MAEIGMLGDELFRSLQDSLPADPNQKTGSDQQGFIQE